MFSFFKNNSDAVLKLFVNQIGMTIFGLLLSAATFSKFNLLIATGILSAVFYLYLVYSAAWDIGSRDKIKIDGNRMKKSPFKGVYLGILANVPNILLSVIVISCYFLGEYAKLQWAANTTAVTYNISWLLNGMYISLLSFIKAVPYKFFALAATVIPSITAAGLGYLAGIQNFRLTGLLGLGKKK